MNFFFVLLLKILKLFRFFKCSPGSPSYHLITRTQIQLKTVWTEKIWMFTIFANGNWRGSCRNWKIKEIWWLSRSKSLKISKWMIATSLKKSIIFASLWSSFDWFAGDEVFGRSLKISGFEFGLLCQPCRFGTVLHQIRSETQNLSLECSRLSGANSSSHSGAPLRASRRSSSTDVLRQVQFIN